jgi:hypothetical protein
MGSASSVTGPRQPRLSRGSSDLGLSLIRQRSNSSCNAPLSPVGVVDRSAFMARNMYAIVAMESFLSESRAVSGLEASPSAFPLRSLTGYVLPTRPMRSGSPASAQTSPMGCGMQVDAHAHTNGGWHTCGSNNDACLKAALPVGTVSCSRWMPMLWLWIPLGSLRCMAP